MRRRVDGWLVGLPFVGALAAASPVAAAGVVGLVSAGILYGVAQPLTIMAATAFLTTAFPKAGVNLGGFPLPVMMFVLFAAIPFLRQRRSPTGRPADAVAILALGWLVVRLAMMFFAGGPASDAFARALDTPHELDEGEGPGHEDARLHAPRPAAVPGLTRAIGVDYSRKPLQFVRGREDPEHLPERRARGRHGLLLPRGR